MGKRQRARKERRNLKLVVSNRGKKISASGMIKKVTLPDDEKELLKTVPAKVDGVVVGEAYLYDDGSVDFVLDKDADPEKLKKIHDTAEEFGYMIGGDDGPT